MIKRLREMPRNARIDAIQNFYGQTFRDKKGNELKMFKKVQTINTDFNVSDLIKQNLTTF